MSTQAAKRIKTESGAAADAGPAAEVEMDPGDLKVLEACDVIHDRSPDHLADHVGITKKELAPRLNRLSAAGKVIFVAGKNGTAMIKRTSEELMQKKKKYNEMETVPERLVYQHVEEAKSKGVWAKHLRSQTGLEKALFQKVIKKLESKKLIKSVSSVSAPKQKNYMLFDTVPDVSLTGGAWYSGQDFDAEFINFVAMLAHRYTKKRNEQAAREFPDEPLRRLQKSLVTAIDVVAYIEANKFSKQTLCEKDLADVLRVLVYDGKLECHEPEITQADDDAAGAGEAKVARFRIRAPAPVLTGVLTVPCGLCPNCEENIAKNELMSPKPCLYPNGW